MPSHQDCNGSSLGLNLSSQLGFRANPAWAPQRLLLTHPSALLPGLHLRRAGGGQRSGHLAAEEEKG